MAAATLAEAKAQIRVIHDADDGLIQIALDAAEQAAADFIKRAIPWDDGALVPAEVPVPAPVKSAVLLLVESLYEGEEAPEAVWRMLWPYRMQNFA